MKKITIVIIILLIFKIGNAQIKVSELIGELNLNSRLDSITFNNFLKEAFNSVANSSGRNTIGNYASSDIKDGQLNFNASKNFKNGNVFSLNASGGITDGFFAIFNQTKVNSNVGISVKYNIRLNSSSISFHTDELAKLNKKISDAKIENAISKTIYTHTLTLLKSKIALTVAEINSIDTMLTNSNLTVEQRAKLEYQLALNTLKQDSLQLKQQTFISPIEADNENRSKEKKSKTNALLDFKYTGIFFQWISIGGGFQNNNFNQFKPSFSKIEEQITRESNLLWNATIEYNIYKWNQYSKPTYYLLFGAKGSIDDNFSDLAKVEINDANTYGTSLNQRTTTKKFNAYKGDYKTKLLSAKFYVDYYRFFFKNEAAIHIYPEATFKQDQKTLYNAGFGLLYSFIDSKDKENKAKLHAELYFKLSDLSNIEKSNLSTFRRNELGLRLSIPVSFLNF